MVANDMIVIAHRGASAYAPENTEAAFDLAIAMRADAIETDLRRTQDGVIVLIHDAQVNRTTDGHGRVEDMVWSALQTLDAGRWKHSRFAGQRIPTLDWFLDRYGPLCPLYLELKGQGVEESAALAIRQRRLEDQVVFTSFDLDAVVTAGRLVSVRTCWLVREWSETVAQRARDAGLYEVSINVENVDAEIAQRVRSTGLGVRAWGLRDEVLMRRAVTSGVDGVTIDFPDRLIPLLRPSPTDDE